MTQKYTGKTLGAMKLSQLIDIYNEVTGKSVKTFGSKPKAVSAILKAQSAVGKSAKAPKAAKSTGEKGERKTRAMNFDMEGSKTVKEPRENSKRMKLLSMLSGGGATFETIKESFGWSTRDAYEGVRLLNIKHGYTLYVEGDKIHAKVK